MTAAGGALEAIRFSPRGALRMWQRNATVARKTIGITLVPRFIEGIAYLAIMGLGPRRVPRLGARDGLPRLHRARRSPPRR